MSGLRRRFVLAFRMQRWEVLAVVAGTTGLTAFALWLTRQLQVLAEAYPPCIDLTLAGIVRRRRPGA
jgi:hypothetical protein